MAYAILRMEKIGSFGEAGGINAHIERTMMVPNADPKLRHLNERLVGSGDLVADIKARHGAVGYGSGGKKIRKNAVLANEFILTASHEAFPFFKDDGKLKVPTMEHLQNWKDFRATGLKFMQDRFGKDNLVNFTVHMDEETPHIHAVIVPIVDGKLNSRAIFGGRDKLRQLQTDFAKAVEHIGLKRGIEGSKAKHTTVKEWYSELEKGRGKAQEAINKIDSKGVKIEFNDATTFNTKSWVKGQERAANEVLGAFLNKTVLPILKNAAQIETERDKLAKENAEMLADLRKVLIEKKLTPDLRTKYIPDIVAAEWKVNQDEIKKANKAAETAAETQKREEAIDVIKKHQLADGLRPYDINRMMRGEKVEVRIDKLILYLAWDKIEGKVRETCFFGNEQAALFEKYKNGTLDLGKDDGKSRGVSR